MRFKKKILIVGGYGFLGKNLVKKFIELNSYETHILVKQSTKKSEKLILEQTFIHFVEDSLNDTFFKTHKFNVIIDCSVCYGKHGNNLEVFKTNLISPLEILQLSNSYTKSFIFFDSYFSKNKFKHLNYLKNYTNSKKYLYESITNNFNHLKIIFLRLEHMYGPNDSDHKFVKYVYNYLSSNNNYLDLTDCDQKRDFIHIYDVFSLIKKCIERMKDFNLGVNLYEIGTGKSISLKDFVLKMKEIYNSSTKINFGKIPKRENEIMDSYSDLKINHKLDWWPKIGIYEGIKSLDI